MDAEVGLAPEPGFEGECLGAGPNEQGDFLIDAAEGEAGQRAGQHAGRGKEHAVERDRKAEQKETGDGLILGGHEEGKHGRRRGQGLADGGAMLFERAFPQQAGVGLVAVESFHRQGHDDDKKINQVAFWSRDAGRRQ